MRVAKWGNSLAIRLPAAVVEALELKEGDEVEVRVAGLRSFDLDHDKTPRARACPSSPVSLEIAAGLEV